MRALCVYSVCTVLYLYTLLCLAQHRVYSGFTPSTICTLCVPPLLCLLCVLYTSVYAAVQSAAQLLCDFVVPCVLCVLTRFVYLLFSRRTLLCAACTFIRVYGYCCLRVLCVLQYSILRMLCVLFEYSSNYVYSAVCSVM